MGDFGVEVRGEDARITAPVRQLFWGDVTQQGLPFYGGTIRYHVAADLAGASHLAIEHAAAPLVDVHLGDGPAQAIFRAPWTIALPATGDAVSKASNETTSLTIDCYGSRINTFGQLHNVAPHYHWWGPASWRTTGADWSDGYHPRATGILVAPRLLGQK